MLGGKCRNDFINWALISHSRNLTPVLDKAENSLIKTFTRLEAVREAYGRLNISLSHFLPNASSASAMCCAVFSLLRTLALKKPSAEMVLD